METACRQQIAFLGDLCLTDAVESRALADPDYRVLNHLRTELETDTVVCVNVEYILFQKFLPYDDYDTRVTVIFYIP
jgi:hypothetical protein